MRLALIVNPDAGTSPIAKTHLSDQEFKTTLLETLRELDIEADVYSTTPDDPGEAIARQLASEKTRFIVVVGGDGTIHSVVHGMLGSASILGIIPAGTMNNLAYSLGIPTDLRDACALLRDGEIAAIDAGKINDHLFLEVAGVGLEAALYPSAEKIKSSGLSSIKAFFEGLSILRNFRSPLMQVTFDSEKPRTYRALEITICNSPYYGVHFNLKPDIFLNDGWLDVAIYKNFSKSEFFRHAFAITQGRRTLTPKIIFRRVKTLRIRSSKVVKVEADGEVIGSTPAEITILPGALNVLVPQKPGPGWLLAPEETVQPTHNDIQGARNEGKQYV
ncbi:MAG TPA: diacylglycerol kinase family protein [Ktedonobacteraceae bacterium]